jgi:hypothetical protein
MLKAGLLLDIAGVPLMVGIVWMIAPFLARAMTGAGWIG